MFPFVYVLSYYDTISPNVNSAVIFIYALVEIEELAGGLFQLLSQPLTEGGSGSGMGLFCGVKCFLFVPRVNVDPVCGRRVEMYEQWPRI